MSFPGAAVPLGRKEHVMMVYAPNPSEFVVQLANQSDMLAKMMDQIAGEYGTGQGRVLSKSLLRPGTPCVARYAEDGIWYRAMVEYVGVNAIHVHFVDFGNHEEVTPLDVMEITPKFLTVPMLGIQCSLMGAHPAGDKWTDEMAESFLEMTDGKQLQALFVQNTGKMVDVILEDIEDESGISINEIFGVTFEVLKAAIPVKSMVIVPKTTPSLPSQDVHFAVPVFASETREKVIVTWFISPGEFYCQSLSFERDFRDLVNEIQMSSQERTLLTSSVPVGTPVIAKFPDDGVLYRAEVKEQKNSQSCLVEYVDYGNCSVLKLSDLWHIESRFMALPRQAVLCSLSGVKPVDSQWPSSSQEFNRLFGAEELECVFHETTDGRYSVSLYLDGKSLAVELVARGLAAELLYSVLEEGEPFDLGLCKGQQLAAHITFIEKISKFFVQLNPDFAGEVQEYVNQFVQQTEIIGSFPVDELIKHALCLATPDGTQWYRARILDVITSKHVLVNFVDYGDCDQIALDKMIPIPEELAGFHPQATECFVSGSETIPDDLENQFKAEVEDHDVILLVDAVVDRRLCVRLFDADGLRLEMLKSISDSSVLMLEPVCPLPVMSCTESVWVSHVEGPNCLWLQYASNEALLAELLELLYKFYETDAQGQLLDKHDEGHLCAAKSAKDDSWYRAKVKSVARDGVCVIFIDYGNSEVVAVENVRELDASFFSPHALSLCTSLAVIAKDESKVTAQLVEMLTDKELTATFTRTTTGKWLVDLQDGGTSVDQQLIKCGLAVQVGDSSLCSTPVVYSTVSLPKGDHCAVFLSHFESPSEFFVQPESYYDDILIFQQNLEQRITNLKNLVKPPGVGTLCAAQFSEDSAWYRALVLESTATSVKVRFVDYGNIEEICMESNGLKILSEDLSRPPFYAVRCSLAVGHIEQNDEIKRLEELLLQPEQVVQLKVLGTGDPMMVRLVASAGNAPEMLVEGGLVSDRGMKESECTKQQKIIKECDKYIEVDKIKKENDECNVVTWHVTTPAEFWIQEDSVTVQLESMTERLAEAASFTVLQNVREGILCAALFPEDELWYRARILKIVTGGARVQYIDYGNSSLCTELRALPEDVINVPPLAKRCLLMLPDIIQPQFCGADETQVKIGAGGDPMIVILNEDDKLSIPCDEAVQPSECGTVSISHVNSPVDFWVQYSSSSSQLDEIAEELASAENYEPLPEPVDGALCAARFPEDDQWYRAEVLSYSEQEIEVFFIDYGNSSFCTDLRCLPVEVLKIPPVAKHCSLAFPEGWAHWPQAAEEEFINIFGDGSKMFELTVVHEGDPTVVGLGYEGLKVEELILKKSLVDVGSQQLNVVKVETGEDLNCFVNVKKDPDAIIVEELKEPDMLLEKNNIVVISHVISPKDFWVQCDSSSALLDKVTDNLTLAEKFDPLSTPVAGGLCAAQFSEDDQWYRAKVLSCSEQEVEVFFIDYGNSSLCTELRCLPVEVLQIPPLAKHCILALPEGWTHWPQAAEDEFMNIFGDGSKAFELTVVQEGDPTIVNLSCEGLRVEDEILKMCQMEIGCQVPNIVKAEPCQDLNNIASDNVRNISGAEEYTEANTYDMPVLIEKEPSAFTVLLNEPEMLLNKREIVSMSHAISPKDFWVQYDSLFSLLAKVTEKLALAEDFLPLSTPVVGVLCAAQFPEDEQWYRAIVVCCNEQGIKVFFIDYGNSSLCTELRCLPLEILQIPPVAKHCCLALPKGWTHWPQAAEQEFMNIFGDGSKAFELTVLQEGDPAVVSLSYKGIKVESEIERKYQRLVVEKEENIIEANVNHVFCSNANDTLKTISGADVVVLEAEDPTPEKDVIILEAKDNVVTLDIAYENVFILEAKGPSADVDIMTLEAENSVADVDVTLEAENSVTDVDVTLEAENPAVDDVVTLDAEGPAVDDVVTLEAEGPVVGIDVVIQEPEGPAVEILAADDPAVDVDVVIQEANNPAVDIMILEADDPAVDDVVTLEAEGPAVDIDVVIQEADDPAIEIQEEDDPAVDVDVVIQEADNPAVDIMTLEADDPAVDDIVTLEAEGPAVDIDVVIQEADDPAVEIQEEDDPAVDFDVVIQEADNPAVDIMTLEAENHVADVDVVIVGADVDLVVLEAGDCDVDVTLDAEGSAADVILQAQDPAMEERALTLEVEDPVVEEIIATLELEGRAAEEIAAILKAEGSSVDVILQARDPAMEERVLTLEAEGSSTDVILQAQDPAMEERVLTLEAEDPALNEIATMLEAGGHAMEEVAATLEEDGHAVEEVPTTLEADGHAVEEVATTLEADGHAAEKVAATVEAGGHAAEEVAATVEAGGHAAEEVAATVEGGGHAAEEVAATVEGGGHAAEEVATIVEVDDLAAKEVEAILEADGHAVEDIAVTLEAEGLAAEEIAVTLEADGLAVEEVAATLEADGHAAEEVAVTLEADGLAVEEVAATLEADGHAAEEVAVTFEADGLAVEEVAATLEEDGHAAEEVAVTFEADGLAVEEVAATLEADGHAVEEIAVTLEAEDPAAIALGKLKEVAVFPKPEGAIIQLCIDQQISLPLGGCSIVTVTHVISANNFWVLRKDTSSLLVEVAYKLAHAGKLDPLLIAVEGTLCVSKLPEDKQLYRAKIVCCNEQNTEVLFIDSGKSSICTDLQCLPTDLSLIPPLAKHCSLVLPEGWTHWSQSAKEEFMLIVGDESKSFELTVLQEGDPAIVSLSCDGIKVECEMEKRCAVPDVNTNTGHDLEVINSDNLKHIPVAEVVSTEEYVVAQVDPIPVLGYHAVVLEGKLEGLDIMLQETKDRSEQKSPLEILVEEPMQVRNIEIEVAIEREMFKEISAGELAFTDAVETDQSLDEVSLVKEILAADSVPTTNVETELATKGTLLQEIPDTEPISNSSVGTKRSLEEMTLFMQISVAESVPTKKVKTEMSVEEKLFFGIPVVEPVPTNVVETKGCAGETLLLKNICSVAESLPTKKVETEISVDRTYQGVHIEQVPTKDVESVGSAKEKLSEIGATIQVPTRNLTCEGFLEQQLLGTVCAKNPEFDIPDKHDNSVQITKDLCVELEVPYSDVTAKTPETDEASLVDVSRAILHTAIEVPKTSTGTINNGDSSREVLYSSPDDQVANDKQTEETVIHLSQS